MSTLTPVNVLNRVFDETIPELRLTNARFLSNLIDRGRVRTWGKSTIDWTVGAGGETTQWTAIDQDAAASNQGTTVPALLGIGSHRLEHRFTLNKVRMREAASVAPGYLKDLFGASVSTALIELMRRLNSTLLTGDGTAASGNVVGLSQVLSAASYAGIATATVPEWAAVRNTNATPRAFTRSLMVDQDVAIANRETTYDLVMASATTVGAYTKIFDTLGAGATLVSTNEQAPKRIDLGHGSAYWNGMPIVQDTQMANGVIYTMDTSQVFLNFLELPAQPDGEGESLNNTAINTAFGFPIHITELPQMNPTARSFVIHIYPQLQFMNRKALQAIDQLTV
jgi:hypothetical protein